ncbi:hypothetical protein ABBQ32_008145 [Trebouxia sp. C0010 RCD-2024]
MTIDLADLLNALESVIQQLTLFKEAKDIDPESEAVAWQRLSTVEELFMELFDDRRQGRISPTDTEQHRTDARSLREAVREAVRPSV